MTIKDITIEYETPTGRSKISRGDTLTGRVVLELSKETKIERLLVRAKGKASVFWSQHYIYAVVTYKAKENVFFFEQILLDRSRSGSKVLPAGRHVFNFAFDIPNIQLPPFWVGRHGRISYSLEARASRSMRLDRKYRTVFFVSPNMDYSSLDIMKPQQVKDERKGLFSSGKTALNVSTKKMGYLPGETLEVTSHTVNDSKDKVTPRYVLYEKQSFFCKNKRKVHTKDILEEKGEPVMPGTQLTETRQMTIPKTLDPTIVSCGIIKLEYRVKVFLDGPVYSPEVKLPIVVLTESIEHGELQ